MIRVAIGGVSNSGKSKLALEIKKYLVGKKVIILCQDDYVLPTSKLHMINDHIDWESPGSIDMARFRQAILSESDKCDLLISEGLMIFHHPEITDLFQKKIFIDLPEKEFFNRKKQDFRWGQEPGWYIEHIWESYMKFGQPPSNENLLIINGTQHFQMDAILRFLNI